MADHFGHQARADFEADQALIGLSRRQLGLEGTQLGFQLFQARTRLVGFLFLASKTRRGALLALLEQALLTTEQQTRSQFVVVTLPTLNGRKIEDVGLELGRTWKIGRFDVDDGVMLIVACAMLASWMITVSGMAAQIVGLHVCGVDVVAESVLRPLEEQSGGVVEVNAALADKPETINEDAYGEGWLFTLQIEEPDQLKELLGPDDYSELLEEDDH